LPYGESPVTVEANDGRSKLLHRVWTGEIESADEREAIEKPANEFCQHAMKRIEYQRRDFTLAIQ